MKKILAALFILLLTLSSNLVFHGSVIAESSKEYVIYLKGTKEKKEIVARSFITANKKHLSKDVLLIKSSEFYKAKEKKKKGEIAAISENKKFKLAVTPNDTKYNLQWGLPKISAPNAWDITTGDSSKVIAVIDTGFSLDHPDLSGKYTLAKYDAIDDDNDPSIPPVLNEVVEKSYYHGTAVAGVIAASTNNSNGISGVDWQAKMMPIRAINNDGYGDLFDIIAGLNWAVTNGADVINMSFGGEDDLAAFETAIENAYSAGVTLVAASGNENTSVSYPAKYDKVIAVGATNSSDVRADYASWGSNYGPELDITAPGVNIYTTAINWNGATYDVGYAYASGTSLAAPFVSGLASLIYSRGDYTPAQVATFIQNGADKVAGMGSSNFTEEYGYGRINAERTLLDNNGISLNSFRITMEDVTTLEDANDYVLAFDPAVGEPVSIRPVLKNDNNFVVNIANLRIKGKLSSGTEFIVGTVDNLTLSANNNTVIPVQSFNITSFYTHTFSIDYQIAGKVYSPYVKPTYTYQKIKAHYPNIKVVKTPAFVPNPIASYNTLIGVFKLKNYDSRPAYLRTTRIWAKFDKNLYYFYPESPKINSNSVYYYEKQIIPYKKGAYSAYIETVYGNGKAVVPPSLLSTSSYGSFSVY